MKAEVLLPPSREAQHLLFGQNDAHLRLLRAEFGVKVIARGERLLLDGEERQVERVAELLDILIRSVEEGETAITQKLAMLIELSEEEREKKEGCFIFTERRRIEARTEGQRRYVEAIQTHPLVFAIGPAGTGKTYLAVACAMEALRHGAIRRIILTRPAVEAGERLGFLPGDMREKVDPYLRPIYDALEDMTSRRQLAQYIETGVIEIAPLAFMRGRTLDRSYVILDEAQNTTPGQMKMFLTRLGVHAKCIVTGDLTQIDLARREESGLVHAMEVLRSIREIAVVTLTKHDIVRHPLVNAIVEAYEEAERGR